MSILAALSGVIQIVRSFLPRRSSLDAKGHVANAAVVGGDASITNSFNKTINPASPPAPADYWLGPGAPVFCVSPGVDRATAETHCLLMQFGQTAGDEVTPVVRWSGANVDSEQPLMMTENPRRGERYQPYQLKPATARPSPPSDEVTFDIEFRWREATRRYRWKWPLYVREKNIWGIHNVAENTLEPKERTTL